MATTNGNGATDGLEATIALEARQRGHSVQHDDYARGEGVFHFMFPATWGEYGRNLAALPESVPAYNRTAFWTSRDIALLSTPKYEAMWGVTVGIAVTKAAAWGWEVESSVPLRRKRAHQVLLNSTAGVFTGWVHFLSAHLRSFMLTGKAIVEIERETRAYGSRIRALHHLDPLRCRITDDPLIPVEYMDRKGKIHELRYWQVMLFADNLDPTEGEYGLVESSAERAYERIKLMAGISRYLYEKVTGKRVLAIELIPGLAPKQLENALQGAEENRAAKGNMIYMGAMLVPLPTDTPVQRVTIPLAEVPDGFNPQQLRDDSTVIYAGATGQDVNDLDPRLASRQSLGSGAQSFILNEKSKGKGLAAWRKQWEHNMNTAVLDDTATTFAWSESSLDDEEKKAKIEEIRTNTNKTRVESQFVSPEQARNLLVDAGDLPKEFLDEDITAGGTIEDDEKNPEKADVDDESTQAPGKADEVEDDEPVEESDTQKERRRPLDVARLLLQEREAAVRLAGELGVTAETTKHLGSQHNQQRHGWRFGGGLETVQRTSKRLEGEERERYQKRALGKLSGGKPDSGGKKPVVQPRKVDPVPVKVEPKLVAKPTTPKPAEKPDVAPNSIPEKAKVARENLLALERESAAKVKRLEKRWRETSDIDKSRKLQEEINQVKGELIERARKKLYVDSPASIDATIEKGIKNKRSVEDGINEFGMMVDRSVVPAGSKVEVRQYNGRAHYKDDKVMLGRGDGGRVAAHELGHWLEEKNPSLRQRVHNFLDRRTAGETAQGLKKATGVNSYGDSEITKRDRFINAYMGKQYIHGGKRYATEILSMGIEMFYADPIALARQDPEYFDFIFAIVRGF